MKSLAEKLEKEVINWREVLSQKEIENWEDLYNLSDSWDTCSVGQLSSLIPRDKNEENIPLDLSLIKAGIAFNDAVEERDAELALFFLNRCEKRAFVVLKERHTEMKQELAELTAYLKENKQ